LRAELRLRSLLPTLLQAPLLLARRLVQHVPQEALLLRAELLLRAQLLLRTELRLR
jgi:hypothetical protein